MNKVSNEYLLEKMLEAKLTVPLGLWVRHLKSDDLYLIVGHAFRESDLEILISYRPRSVSGYEFSRPIGEMISKFVPKNSGRWPDLSSESGGEHA